MNTTITRLLAHQLIGTHWLFQGVWCMTSGGKG